MPQATNRRQFLKQATGFTIGLAFTSTALPYELKAEVIAPVTRWVSDGYLNKRIRQRILQIKSQNPHLRLGETHCHSTFSDGNYSIEDLIRRSSYLGLDFLLITEHQIPKIYPLDRSLLSFQKRLKVYNEWNNTKIPPIRLYPAIETSTQQGHLIVVFPEQYLKQNLYNDLRLTMKPYDSKFCKMDEMAKIARILGGVTLIPHPEIERNYPFGAKISFVQKYLLGLVDGIEDISTGHCYEENFAEKLNIASIGSSDDHFNMLIGTTVTVYDSRHHPDFLSAVRAKETQAVKIDDSLRPFLSAGRLLI